MNFLKHSGTSFFHLALIATILVISTWNCRKTVTVDPFLNSTTLDCRNLLIRSLSLKDSIFELTIQNTCINCKIPDIAYVPFLVINRQTGDTLNKICYCFNPPLNGKTEKYIIVTQLSQLPDLNTIEIDFGGLCKDLTYSPN